jgi:thymidylate synthase
VSTSANDRGSARRAGTIAVESLGEAWLGVARAIIDIGVPSSYDGLPILEIDHVTLDIELPEPADALIEKYADPERLAWMRANFTDPARVAELGDARSYSSRIFDYAGAGRDQLDWVVERLSTDPLSRSATITTFEPLTDTSYIPCVSMLDFWVRAEALELVVYAHSIDFGAKGYGNLVQLAELQRSVAERLDLPVGALVMVVKSAHIYEPDEPYVRGVLSSVASPGVPDETSKRIRAREAGE